MGIKESNLPIAESLGSGDKLRIVTSEGESKQIGAESVGGEAYIVAFHKDPNTQEWSTDRTFAEVFQAIQEKKYVVGIEIGTLDYDLSQHEAKWLHLDDSNPGMISFVRVGGEGDGTDLSGIGASYIMLTAGNTVHYRGGYHSFSA